MKVKQVVAVVLLLVLLISFAGCGVNPKKVVGVWEREPLYMAHYGCETQMILSFAEDGSFTALLLDAQSHNILNYAGGKWTMDGNVVVGKRTESLSGSAEDMRFEYDRAKNVIVFEGYAFKRTDK